MEAVIASTPSLRAACLSMIQLIHQVADNELGDESESVAKLVGRDTNCLDSFGQQRFWRAWQKIPLDQVSCSPIFWGVLFGLPGLEYREYRWLR